jgi:hypothetical protein
MLYTPRFDEPAGRYCGPTAMCAVTGLRLSECKAAIRQSSGKIMDAAGRSHRVTGVDQSHLLGAMALVGWRVAEEWLNPNAQSQYWRKARRGLTFEQFCTERGASGPFIVNVTGHYIAVSHSEMCDPFNVLPVELDAYFKRTRGKPGRYHGAWVQRWWRFEPSPVSASEAKEGGQ